MSNVPHYLSARAGTPYGHTEAKDGILHDGLWDVYNNIHMGNCAEKTAKDFNIDRSAQDAYAELSYKKSARAWEAGTFNDELAPVTITGRRGQVTVVDEDEEYKNVDFEKMSSLRTVFQKVCRMVELYQGFMCIITTSLFIPKP